jgi:(p)ppGpp synthase/HD superfamily hydrolase
MFRHQLDTVATLLDYGYVDSVLLKAAMVHDVIEDVPGFNHDALLTADCEGQAVYDLVLELTRVLGETKPEFLTRILETGSPNAKLLKVADRISNMIALGLALDTAFIDRYIRETTRYVFPIAEEVDRAMLRELESLVVSRQKHLAVLLRHGERGAF